MPRLAGLESEDASWTRHTLEREAGLRGLWLEVTNHNLPAIRFYQRVGFELCGVDTSLYDPEGDASGECALFFFRPIDPD